MSGCALVNHPDRPTVAQAAVGAVELEGARARVSKRADTLRAAPAVCAAKAEDVVAHEGAKMHGTKRNVEVAETKSGSQVDGTQGGRSKDG